MATELKRMMLTIPSDLEDGLDRLKQQKFYKTSQSNMLAYLLRLGLQTENGEKKNGSNQLEEKPNKAS